MCAVLSGSSHDRYLTIFLTVTLPTMYVCQTALFDFNLYDISNVNIQILYCSNVLHCYGMYEYIQCNIYYD